MNKAPLTKDQFVHYINFIKERKEKEDIFNKLFTEEFEDSIFYPYSRYETELVNLLETIFEGDDTISYFIYELDFGRVEFANRCITNADGTAVSLTTPEELYDYLIKEHLYL